MLRRTYLRTTQAIVHRAPFHQLIAASRLKVASNDLSLLIRNLDDFDEVLEETQTHLLVDTWGQTWGYRREKVTWDSPYGRPSEEHLLLYHIVAAWIKDQKPMALGAYDRPCTVIGAVRLDNGEHIGSEIGIWQVSTTNSSPALPIDVKANYQQANQEGTKWHSQKYFFLKDTIMSCTHAEVQELSTKFTQRQAQKQMALIQAELLQRVQDIRSG